jgi:hypothetical protein
MDELGFGFWGALLFDLWKEDTPLGLLILLSLDLCGGK